MEWGVVGYGWVARDHMHPALHAAGHRLVGVYDPDPRACAAARRAGAEPAPHLDALLDRAEAVYVATPNHAHADPVLRALAAGVPVLCEKPMAATLADARSIADAAGASGTLYGTAFDQRHHPAHVRMRETIADGRLGRVTAVRIVYACWLGPAWSPTGARNWRVERAAAGGGAGIDLALHGLDLAQMLLGEPLVELAMLLQRRVHDYAVDDGGVLIGRFGSGALLQAHIAYNCPETLPRRRLEVIGEHGQLTAIDTMGQSAGGRVTWQCGRNGAGEPVAFDDRETPFGHQARAFASAVAGGPHDFSAERDLALMALFDAAHRKAQSCL
jgi:1,5-anhydro-D-fructose reductase (1,5-anhydro-D-mannitol-forming)